MNRLWIILGIVGIALIVIIILPYTSARIPVCGLCHATKKEYRSWKKSSHSKVNCVTCHYKPGVIGFVSMELEGFNNFRQWLFRYSKPVRAGVNNNSCLRCHQGLGTKTVKSPKIQMSHKEVLKGWQCSQCHGSVGHKIRASKMKTASMDKCFNCHDNELVDASCNICHLSKANYEPKNPILSGTIAHVSNWEKIHGGSKLISCHFCHNDSFCQKCHSVDLSHLEDWPFIHGKRAVNDERVCLKCHNRIYCDFCHISPMPHPSDFFLNHAQQAENAKKETCMRCHSAQNCDVCHVKRGMDPVF